MIRKIILSMTVIVAGISGSYAGVNDIYAYQDTPNGLWGFCDYWGNVIVTPRYERVEQAGIVNITPSTDLSAVKESNGKWGFIDKKCNLKINFKYEDAQNFHFGLGAVKDSNGKWGLINEQGYYVIRPQYDYLTFNDTDNLWTSLKSDKTDNRSLHGTISVTGEVILQPQFKNIYFFGVDGIASAEQNGKYGYIDRNGNLIVDFVFDGGYSFSEGLAAVKTNSKWGFVDKTGKFVIEPQFENAFTFSEGVAPVKLNQKWGFIDKAGKLVIEPQFEDVYEFSEGLSAVKLNQKWGFIDKTGKFVIKPKFDNIRGFSFKSGFAIVTTNERPKNQWDPYIKHTGMINKSGFYVILPEYEDLLPFEDDIAVATVIESDYRVRRYVDKSGNCYSNLRDALKAVHRR